MARTKVFTSNRSQAVRLPKPVAFPDSVREVEVLKAGKSRIITPVGHRWDDLFDNGPRTSPDFLTERDQPPAQARRPL